MFVKCGGFLTKIEDQNQIKYGHYVMSGVLVL